MYLHFFGLNEAPFAITPDPAFVYLSAAHRDALAHLLYGVGQGGAGGFVQLTGEVGTGKTTLCRCLMEQIPDGTRVALVLNPLQTPTELLATICEELRIDIEGVEQSNKAMVDRLNRFLLEEHALGHRVVVVIDEAQNLSPEALEQVRLLTNLETAKDKLLQMVLLGQPELRDLLRRQELRQLAQRITARYHLAPLNPEETFAYVRHRMKVAGAQRQPFRKAALRALYQRSAGVPRLINIIADRALAGAYAREAGTVSAALVHAAANEVQPSEKRVRSNPWPALAGVAATLAVLAAGLVFYGPRLVDGAGDPEPTRASAQVVTPSENPPRAEPVPADPVVDEPTRETGDVIPAVGALAVADEAPGSSLVRELETEWLEQESRGAWRSLAELWRDAGGADSIQRACDGAPATGYACVRESGSWSRIQRLGLPVLLVLQGEGSSLLLLRGFSDSGVLLGAGADPLEAPRDAIERNWLGDYIVAWPQAPDWPGEIRRGEAGAAVDIVMEMAAYAEPAWNGGGIFDSGFENWLRTFQQRHGLKADGIIGPNTLIYLMAPTIREPRLIVADEENS
ncbi:MAG: AAA family ATPase [Gammaproteobacteria bacterium]|nr:AAA family ATPase [Gammaproteobacteria bacterium]